jgi:hypothetical protein
MVLNMVRVPEPMEASPPGADILSAAAGFERSSVLPAISLTPTPRTLSSIVPFESGSPVLTASRFKQRWSLKTGF